MIRRVRRVSRWSLLSRRWRRGLLRIQIDAAFERRRVNRENSLNLYGNGTHPRGPSTPPSLLRRSDSAQDDRLIKVIRALENVAYFPPDSSSAWPASAGDSPAISWMVYVLWKFPRCFQS